MQSTAPGVFAMGWTALGVLVCLVGWGEPPEKSKAAVQPPAATAPAPEGKLLAEYNARAAATPEKAGLQWELALWCEKNGLTAEAYTHFAAVVRLDPSRAAAWQKLGFTKRDGVWLNPNELAESDRQKAADALWAPRLKAIHKDIHSGGEKQEAAEEALAAIDDPRAVPAVFREFGRSGRTDQLIAIRTLGHIQAPLATRLLATMAVYGQTPEARRQAVETLRSREPDEYLGVLAGMLSDPLRYEVRPVDGPGSQGEIFINGRKFNVRRVYRPPTGPSAAMTSIRPGDFINYDANGMPVILRKLSSMEQYIPIPGTFDPITERQWFQVRAPYTMISGTQIVLETQRAAQAAQSQLMADVDALNQLNAEAKDFNRILLTAASHALGKPLGDEPQVLRNLVRQRGLDNEGSRPAPPKATYTEFVPPVYQPVYELSLILPFYKNAPFN